MRPQLTSELVEVGRYKRLSAANERGLAVLAMGMGYWLFMDDGDYVLCVEAQHGDAVISELEKYERETRLQRFERHAETSFVPLFFFGWFMTLCMLFQQNAPRWLVENGVASSRAIVRDGELWRSITALTLHSDVSHFAANLVTGLLFCALVLPLYGSGMTWAGVLVSGACGNLITALCYRETTHLAIGASTAVFGALGMLIAGQTILVFSNRKILRKWEIILPPGAGLAFLGYLGAGDERTDLLAHLWGFVCGIAVGVFTTRLRTKERWTSRGQRVLVGLVVIAICTAWLCAALRGYLPSQAFR
jgi:rhomboid protease GluP